MQWFPNFFPWTHSNDFCWVLSISRIPYIEYRVIKYPLSIQDCRQKSKMATMSFFYIFASWCLESDRFQREKKRNWNLLDLEKKIWSVEQFWVSSCALKYMTVFRVKNQFFLDYIQKHKHLNTTQRTKWFRSGFCMCVPNCIQIDLWNNKTSLAIMIPYKNST